MFNVILILLGEHCTGKKSLYNFVWEVPDKIAQEKVLCGVVLVLLG